MCSTWSLDAVTGKKRMQHGIGIVSDDAREDEVRATILHGADRAEGAPGPSLLVGGQNHGLWLLCFNFLSAKT